MLSTGAAVITAAPEVTELWRQGVVFFCYKLLSSRHSVFTQATTT